MNCAGVLIQQPVGTDDGYELSEEATECARCTTGEHDGPISGQDQRDVPHRQ